MFKNFLLISASFSEIIIPQIAQAQAQTTQVAPEKTTAQSTQTPSKSDKKSKPTRDSATIQEKEEQEIIVVGSRIRHGVKNVSQKVQTINAEDAARTGRTSMREMLQSTGVTQGGDQNISTLNQVLVDGGPGVANISLRRLGPTRTLVLLNGRRLSPAGVGGSVSAADLNTVPSAMVGQMQILKDGASSIYGSDAMGGVVDIITRKGMDGIEGSAVVNMADESGGERYRISTAGGYSTDRFKLTIGIDYTMSRELEFGDRKQFRCPISYRIDPESSNPVPGSADNKDPKTGKPVCWPNDAGGMENNFLGTGLIDGYAYDGTPYKFYIWIPNDSITKGIPGMEGVNTPMFNDEDENWMGMDIQDKYSSRQSFFNDALLDQSLEGQTRNIVGMASMTYDLQALGEAEAYVDILGSDRRYFFDFALNDVLDYVQGSPLIPEEWSSPDKEFWMYDPNTVSKGKKIAARAIVLDGVRRGENKVSFWRISSGLRGMMPMPGWHYDVAYTWARSNASQKTPVRLTDRVRESSDVLVENGIAKCANAEARKNGCVPMPQFSAGIFKKGGLPKAWLNYISHEMTTRTIYTDSALNADFDGPLFDLPYGTAKGAFGAEVRFYSLNDQPDSESIADNIHRYRSSQITRGSSRSYEAYGEIELPLLTQVPLVKSLTVNLSGRLSKDRDFSLHTTYKAGALYTPFSWLSLRGSYSSSYRTPGLFERYLGGENGFMDGGEADPCYIYGLINPKDSPRYKNCQSEGLPIDYIEIKGPLRIRYIGGKESGLKPETSRNISTGLVAQPVMPTWFGNIVMSGDFYHISIADSIISSPAEGLIRKCYDDPLFRNGGEWCQFVGERDPITKKIAYVSKQYMNYSNIKTSGLDFEITYTRGIGIGSFGLNLTAAYLLSYKSRLSNKDKYIERGGELTFPRWSGTAAASYSYKRWDFGYDVEWVGPSSDARLYGKYDQDYLKTIVYSTNHYFLHSLSIGYRADTWRGTFAVRNVTNALAPRISTDTKSKLGDMLYYSGYDFFGRAYTLSINKKF